jgi:ligand-binding sensor domain-containing protein
MTLTKRLYFLLALLLCLSCLHAQSVAPLWCHQIGTKEGLSSQTFNYYTFLDQTGFIWFSSTRGLNRFDGRRVVNYRSDPDNPHALMGENIQSRMLVLYLSGDSLLPARNRRFRAFNSAQIRRLSLAGGLSGICA